MKNHAAVTSDAINLLFDLRNSGFLPTSGQTTACKLDIINIQHTREI